MLAFEEPAAGQARYFSSSQRRTRRCRRSSHVLQLAGDAPAGNEELGVVKAAISEREQAQRLAFLEEINPMQTAAHAWEIIGLYAQLVKGHASLRFKTRLLFS